MLETWCDAKWYLETRKAIQKRAFWMQTMNTRIAINLFAIITDTIIYFMAGHYFVLLWGVFGKSNAFIALFLLSIMFAFLSCVTYLGAWLIIARRNRSIFWKAFVLCNIFPWVAGAISTIVY